MVVGGPPRARPGAAHGGDLPGAVDELRTALRLASRSGDADRTADVRASLGVTLICPGSHQAWARASGCRDRAVPGPVAGGEGVDAPRRVSLVGPRPPQEGLADLERRADGLRADRTTGLGGPHRGFLGLMHLAVGDVAAAEQHTTAARDRFVRLGRGAEAVQRCTTRAWSAYVKGDLPAALSIFDRCEDEFADHGDRPDASHDRPVDGAARGRAGGRSGDGGGRAAPTRCERARGAGGAAAPAGEGVLGGR